MNMRKLICSECKEELCDDNRWSRGDDIYCCGISSPHDHYKDLEQARESVAENEIRDAYIEEVVK